MKARLNELTSSITVGQIMSRVSVKDEEDAYGKDVRVLIPSAISGGTVHKERISTAKLKKEVSVKRITKKDDIVIKLSSPYDCALITAEDEGLVVPSFCAVIRGADQNRVDKHYLLGYLNSAYTMTKLMAGINASALAMVRLKSLEDLEIELPAMILQNAAGNAYWESCHKKYILELMVDQQQKVSDSIIIETLKEARRNGHDTENEAK